MLQLASYHWLLCKYVHTLHAHSLCSIFTGCQVQQGFAYAAADALSIPLSLALSPCTVLVLQI